MGTQDRLARLRAVLYMTPSRSTWLRVCKLLDGWPASEDRDVGIDYASGALEGWSDGLRLAPRHWLDKLSRGKPVPQARIARTVDLSSFGNRTRLATLEKITASPALEATRRLVLGGQRRGKLFAALPDTPLWRGLTHLDLSGCGLKAANVRALAESSGLGQLQALDLEANKPGPEGIEALSQAEGLTKLTSLSLARCGLRPKHVDVLASSEALRSVRHLRLGNNKLGAKVATALGVRLATLHSLNLDKINLGDEGVKAMAGFLAPELSALSVVSNGLGDEGALMISRLAPGLRTLNLSHNPIGPRGLEALVETTGAAHLVHLDLNHTAIGTEGAQAMARSPFLTGLQTLSMAGCQIGDAGLGAMVRSGLLEGVTSLDLSLNDIRKKGLASLAGSKHLSAIESLDLSYNTLDPASLLALIESPNLGRLKSLGLIGFKGEALEVCKALAASPSVAAIEDLRIEMGRYAHESYHALRSSPYVHPKVRARLPG